MPKKQLRHPSSTWPHAASRWLHARLTQQPSETPTKERPRLPARRAGALKSRPPGDRSARSPGWRRVVKKWKSQHDTGINSAYTHACPAVRILLYCYSTSWWVGWCVRVGGSVGVCVGGRAGSWLCVVHAFCSFAFWTHGAFTTRRWSAAFELDTRLLLYVIACLLYTSPSPRD